MTGKFARIEAISPRPEGKYRFAVRMKADGAMAVTVCAFGEWQLFDVGTEWDEYSMQIDSPQGGYIDLYPLADTTLYVEKAQLTYGKGSYEWRPAPEDDTDFEWTCVAMDEATVSNIRDIAGYTEYFQLLPASAPAPQKPTVNPPPAPWSQDEATDTMYAATADVDGHGITAAAVDAVTFAHAVSGAAGLYRLTYNGADWTLGGEPVSLRDYGVSTSGVPLAGDSVLVRLTIDTGLVMYRCAVTVYSDGSFNWGDVVRTSSYDAAMAAVSTSVYYQTQVEQLLTSWNATVRATVIDDATHTTVADMLGRIQVTESTVSNLIDETRQTAEGLGERITSLSEQTSQSITNTFTEAKQYADDQYGATKEYVTTAQSWQRFSADGIEQGKLGSPFKSKLTNAELGFYENTEKVAYINNNKFFITNGEIVESLTIGNFVFMSGEGGLGVMYIGSGG